METIGIIIFKWIFVIAAIWLSYYHYRREIKKINIISKQLNDSRLVSSFKKATRSRMLHFLIFFSAFTVWILAYDIVNENVNRKNTELNQELLETANTYNSLLDSQKRLVKTNQGNAHEVVKDTKDYYTDILTNYYVMRQCKLNGTDDIFIINSALMRELALNSIPVGLREDIFKAAKAKYIQDFADYDCAKLEGKDSDLPTTYQDYISTVREIMRATF